MVYAIISLIFTVVFMIMAVDAINRRWYVWTAVLILAGSANGTMFVIELMEALA